MSSCRQIVIRHSGLSPEESTDVFTSVRTSNELFHIIFDSGVRLPSVSLDSLFARMKDIDTQRVTGV